MLPPSAGVNASGWHTPPSHAPPRQLCMQVPQLVGSDCRSPHPLSTPASVVVLESFVPPESTMLASPVFVSGPPASSPPSLRSGSSTRSPIPRIPAHAAAPAARIATTTRLALTPRPLRLTIDPPSPLRLRDLHDGPVLPGLGVSSRRPVHGVVVD